MGREKSYVIGIKRLARAVNEAIRETGWTVGIKRKASGEIFLRPRSDVFNIRNMQERVVRGIDALRLALERGRNYLREGKSVRSALLILPLVPVEWARELRMNPIRFAVFVPYNGEAGCRIVHGIPVRCFNPLEERVPLDVHPVHVGRSVQETLGVHHAASEIGGIAVPNVYVFRLMRDIRKGFVPHFSHSPGQTLTELDGLLYRDGTLHIIEQKSAPGVWKRWDEVVLLKMRTLERAMEYLSKLLGGYGRIHLHFVVTAFGNVNVKHYAQEALYNILQFAPPWETHVYGIQIGEEGYREVYRERVRGRKL